MKVDLLPLDKKIQRIVTAIRHSADKNKLQVYLVGGIVRDLLLKRKNFDLDIVVEGDALTFAKSMAVLMKARLVTYGQFKTATLMLSDGFQFDLVTARQESYSFSGALPVVEPGSLKQDLFRRDFTINAMAISIHKNSYGQLVDYYGGCDDLKKGIIRILYDKSFIEDPTRILRAVRFEQRFDFSMESKTLSLLKDALKKDVVGNVKAPRYFEEFKKVLKEKEPQKSLKRLRDLKALAFLSPKIQWNIQNYKSIKKIHRWADDHLPENIHREPWLIYFMEVLRGVSAKNRVMICQRFQLSRKDSLKVLQSSLKDKIVKNLSAKNILPHEIYGILKPVNQEALLWILSSVSSKKILKHIENYLLKYAAIELKISGHDLKSLGINPGTKMGWIMKKLLEKKIDGQICTYHDEVKLAEQFACS